ncbi:hypothetical protein TWF694_011891 [Orbilia ellipsospora]|uniref:Ribosomal protein S15 n=1 Tax=Orbilia ellipsospora TaxID=2528407 RepID=A0AAV9XCT0_9PEZI
MQGLRSLLALSLSSTLANLRISVPFRASRHRPTEGYASAFILGSSFIPATPSRFTIACLHTSSSLNTRRKRKPPSNPWSVAKAAEKRERVKARKAELSQLRLQAASDPVVGHTTPFLEAMDMKPEMLPPIDNLVRATDPQQRQNMFEKVVTDERVGRLNHFLEPDEVSASIGRSNDLEEPPPAKLSETSAVQGKEMHTKATAAMNRILSLGNGSSHDKTRANKTWCVETFGRHITDELFPQPKHISASSNSETDPTKTPRVGRDTGSSEVQAALLTMKIRALARQLETNPHDKMNKRNLRLMVHKRQKHLKYLKRKERGGERYRYVMESLGLDDNAIMKEVFI